MRRRVDIPMIPFLDIDGMSMPGFLPDGKRVADGSLDGDEPARRLASFSAGATGETYLDIAKGLINRRGASPASDMGIPRDGIDRANSETSAHALRRLARLERAAMELNMGLAGELAPLHSLLNLCSQELEN